MLPATLISCAVLYTDEQGNVVPCPRDKPCADCGDSRDCPACEGHGHYDGERCLHCESLGSCPTCRDRYA